MSYRILGNCIGCALCLRRCPVAAISGFINEPHEINEKRCLNCGICANYCEHRYILNEHGEHVTPIARELWKKPSFRDSECTACSICVDICLLKCVALKEPAYRGDLTVTAELVRPEECTGCGLCAEYCPMNAIEMEGGGIL